MRRNLSFLVLLVFTNIALAKSLLDVECDSLSSSLTGSEVSCLGENYKLMELEQVSQLAHVSSSLQEWLWLSSQMQKKIRVNEDKKKVLNKVKNSFVQEKLGYPKGAANESDLKMVELYKSQYEKLFIATQNESFKHQALNSCYGAGGFRCSQTKIDDLKLQYLEAQSQKLSILMNYPLLSSSSVRETIESEISLYESYQEGELEDYSSLESFSQSRKLARRNNFTSVMLKGIEQTGKSLRKNQNDWKTFYIESKNSAQGEIDFQLGDRSKGFLEKYFSDYSKDSSSYQEDEAQLVSQLLSGVDVNEEFKDPYIGQAVCNIKKRNTKQLEFDAKKKAALDVALFAAPFFLGPIGGAARIATMGRFANWGIKGRLLISASVEGGILSNDFLDIKEASKKCDSIKVALLNTKVTSSSLSGQESTSSTDMDSLFNCEQELANQILVTQAGAIIAPISLINSKSVSKTLSQKGLRVLNKFNETRSHRFVNKLIKSERLSESDALAIKSDFKKFSQKSKLTGKDLEVEYRNYFNSKYEQDICKI